MNKVTYTDKGGKYIKMLTPISKETLNIMEQGIKESLERVAVTFNAFKADSKNKEKHDAYNDAKKKLPMLNVNLFAQESVPLKGARYTLGKASTFGVDYDLDEYVGSPDFKERRERMLNGIMEKAAANGICMVQRTPKGAHVAALRDPALSQLENIQRLDAALGLEHDTNAEDPERVFYHYGMANTLLLDERMFDTMPVAPPDIDYNKVRMRKKGATVSTSSMSIAPSAPSSAAVDDGPCYLNKYPFSEIVVKYWQLYNNGQTPVEGQRDKLTYQLASDLYPLCNGDINLLKRVVPIYDGFPFDEWEKKFESARQTDKQGIPWRIQRVLKELDSELKAKRTAPQMPKQLPQVVKDVTSLTPHELKPTVAASMWAAFSSYLSDVTYPYIDGTNMPTTLMTVLTGPMSSNKSCVEQPIQYIIRDLEEEDKPNRAKENEWMNAQRNGKANTPRPRVPIHNVSPDMTQPILTERFCASDENGRYNLYTHGPELNDLSKIDARGKQDGISQVIIHSFDNTAIGQERWMAEAMSGGAPARLSFNFSTTPSVLRQIFTSSTLENGAVTRLMMVSVPELDPHKMPRYGKYDENYSALLSPYIQRLRAACGKIKCEAVLKLFKKLQRDLADRYTKMETDAAEREVFWSFAKRALAIAFRVANELYIMQGRWDKVSSRFIRWMLEYDLYNKMRYFGDALKSRITNNGHRNFSKKTLYDLPEYFTLDDVTSIGLKPNTVDQYVCRGKVERLGDGHYHRLV